MRKKTTPAGAAPGPQAERKGKKEKKQGDNVEALAAMLSQTRSAQRRLLLLATRLEVAERLIVRALADASGSGAPARRPTTGGRPAKQTAAPRAAKRATTPRPAKPGKAPRGTATP